MHLRLASLASLVLLVHAPSTFSQCQTGTLHSPTPSKEQGFGHVAIDGNTLAVGAPGQDGQGPNSGATFVFDRSTLQLLHTLHPLDAQFNAAFGAAVAVDGSTLIVGSPEHGDDRGAAYLFDLSTGLQTAKLIPSSIEAGDEFGFAVDVHGGVALASSPGLGDNEGAVFVFDVATGAELRVLRPGDPVDGGRFGHAVAIEGNTALVGSPTLQGSSAYIFDTASGAQLHKLEASIPGLRFGWSVDLDGGRALVGLPLSSAVGAHLYDAATGQLLQQFLTSSGGNDRVGASVSLDGDTVALGAPYDKEVAFRGGAVHVYQAATGDLRYVLTHEDAADEDELGRVVCVSGQDLYAATLKREDPFLDAGVVVLFDLMGGALGSNYCGPAVPNSTGSPGQITAFGSSQVAHNCVELHATSLPHQQFGYFLTSQTSGFVQQPGGSQGNLCLGGAIGRFDALALSTEDNGAFTVQVDLQDWPLPLQQAVMPGETWMFTAWYRDLNPIPTSNFTDGIQITFL